MKWTDAMVRLLIVAVYYIGDDCGSEATNSSSSDATGGRKKAGALMQKRGKWKSVSKAMMEKGFYVSPQQCEDKFNDLNKRYKRVNEILGKGTACRVVENQSLLDRMDHLSAKSKEEVRKLLTSKHLFFREMCAYHNSCGSGVGPGLETQTQQKHNSSHDTDMADNPSEDSEEEDGESEQEEEGEDYDQRQVRCSTKRLGEEEDGNGSGMTTALRGLEAEIGEVLDDGRRSGWEKRRWMKMRLLKVEEERVGKEQQGLEIEKERVKWVKYCGKKEREMERNKLRNERAKLECDRMVLLLKHKEIEMMSLFKKAAAAAAAADPQRPSSVTGC